MTSSTKFHVRQAETAKGDGEFIIAAFDSALPYLASIGSQEQWGLIPLSKRDGWSAETLQQVADAEVYRLTGAGDALRIFIVEAILPQERGTHNSLIDPEIAVPVAFAFVREDFIPEYVLPQDHLRIEDAESCVYIEVMVANHQIDNTLRQGSGGAFIREVKNLGRKQNREVLFVDGWAGNDRKLIRSVPLSKARIQRLMRPTCNVLRASRLPSYG